MIALALFLLPYAPRFARPWIMGIVLGRKPERMEPRPLKPTTRVWVAKGYEAEQRAFLKSFDDQVDRLGPEVAHRDLRAGGFPSLQ